MYSGSSVVLEGGCRHGVRIRLSTHSLSLQPPAAAAGATLILRTQRHAWRTHAPTVVPASAIHVDTSSACPGAQYDACKHTAAREQLETAAFWVGRERAVWPLTCDLTETHPCCMAQRRYIYTVSTSRKSEGVWVAARATSPAS